MTAVEGNASVYQVNPVSRITGEGRAEFLMAWGPDYKACLDLGRARGGTRRIESRFAGSIWHGISFRFSETIRSLGTPQTVSQTSIF